jgi:hypothetical protein
VSVDQNVYPDALKFELKEGIRHHERTFRDHFADALRDAGIDNALPKPHSRSIDTTERWTFRNLRNPGQPRELIHHDTGLVLRFREWRLLLRLSERIFCSTCGLTQVPSMTR